MLTQAPDNLGTLDLHFAHSLFLRHSHGHSDPTPTQTNHCRTIPSKHSSPDKQSNLNCPEPPPESAPLPSAGDEVKPQTPKGSFIDKV